MPSHVSLLATALTGLALLLSAAPAAAQGATAQSPAAHAATAPTARLEGIVYDSLRQAPLAGARVQVGDLPQRFVTDSDGRFRADSLPPGPHEVRFTHAVLDSLGMAAAPVRVELQPGRVAYVSLGLPSGYTFFSRLCPEGTGTGLTSGERSGMFGIVRAAENDDPVAGAAVQAQWWTYVVDKVLGVRRKVELRNGQTNATGLYLLCDVPGDADVAFTVSTAGYDTVAVDVRLTPGFALLQHVMLPASRDTATASGASVAAGGPAAMPVVRGATLTGTVRDPAGAPIEGAEVLIVTRTGTALEGPVRTGATGRFSLPGVRAGTRMVEVRRVGYTPVRRVVTIARARETQMDVILPAAAIALPEVTVTGESPEDRTGFSFRRGLGGGQYYTRDDIDRRPIHDAEEFMDQVPGMRVENGNVLNYTSRGGPTTYGCAMATFLDGTLTPPDQVLKVPKDQLQAVEVYNAGSKVPTEFVRPETACGAILVWTKMRR